MHRIELIIERIIFQSRWALAPFYLGLVHMNLEHYDNTKLACLVGIHVLFLGSLLAVVLSDRLSYPAPLARAPAGAKREDAGHPRA